MKSEKSAENRWPRAFSSPRSQSGACGGTTTFATSWRSPKAEPLNLKGEKVAAVAMEQNESMRRSAEDIMAREITHHGAIGVPMYTLMPEGRAPSDEASARAAVEKAGVKGVLVMRPMGTKMKVETHDAYAGPIYGGYGYGGMYGGPMYGNYWGGYFPYGWNSAYAPANTPHGANQNITPETAGPYYPPSDGTYTTKTEVLQVEVLVYSLKQNLLVWAGTSETTEAGKLDDFITQLAAATARSSARRGCSRTNARRLRRGACAGRGG